MSLGYASRLSHREDLGGRLGDPELTTNAHVVLTKTRELAELVRGGRGRSCFAWWVRCALVCFQTGARTLTAPARLPPIAPPPPQTQIRKAERVMAFTGAGISTACGIPDFRGPNGVWTLQRQGKEAKLGVSFVYAQPSLTHQVRVVGVAEQRCWLGESGHARCGAPKTALRRRLARRPADAAVAPP